MLAPAAEFEDRPFAVPYGPGEKTFPIWSRLLNKWLLNSDAQPLADIVPVSVRLRVLPEIRFGWGTVGPSAYSRTRSVVAKDNDDLFLFMNLEGSFEAKTAGREFALAPGEAYVMDCSDRGTHSNPTGGKLLCLRTSRSAMQPLVRDLNGKLGQVLRSDNESLRLLATYMRGVGDSEPLTSEIVRKLATRHVNDLLASVLGATPDAAEMVQERGLRAARLRAAKSLIRRHLIEAHLSAELVAKPLGMSARSVQRLFESEGTSFSAFVADERVAMAYAVLVEPEKAGRSIADIALECGFGDISYFNRKFRSRYGASPSEVRHHAFMRI